MSHYTVMVIGPETDDDLAEALAPYDENKEMEPYRDYLDPDPSKFWTNNDGHLADWPAIIAEYAAKYPDSSDIPLLDEAGLPYEVSTYNPDSKWDWYAIGGRWAGTLRLKAGVLAVPPNTSGWVWKNAGPDELPPSGACRPSASRRHRPRRLAQ
jgi:hypothetical protein